MNQNNEDKQVNFDEDRQEFYIDIGDMSAEEAFEALNKIKAEIDVRNSSAKS